MPSPREGDPQQPPQATEPTTTADPQASGIRVRVPDGRSAQGQIFTMEQLYQFLVETGQLDAGTGGYEPVKGKGKYTYYYHKHKPTKNTKPPPEPTTTEVTTTTSVTHPTTTKRSKGPVDHTTIPQAPNPKPTVTYKSPPYDKTTVPPMDKKYVDHTTFPPPGGEGNNAFGGVPPEVLLELLERYPHLDLQALLSLQGAQGWSLYPGVNINNIIEGYVPEGGIRQGQGQDQGQRQGQDGEEEQIARESSPNDGMPATFLRKPYML